MKFTSSIISDTAGPVCRPAAIAHCARRRSLAARAQYQLPHVPIARANGILAQQMHVTEAFHARRSRIQFDQGVIPSIDVGEEESSVSAFAGALIADVG